MALSFSSLFRLVFSIESTSTSFSIDPNDFLLKYGMDDSYSSYSTYSICYLILVINFVYLLFVSIKVSFQYQNWAYRMSDIRITTGISIKTGPERLAQLYPHIGEDTPLPSKWNSKEKPSTLLLQQNSLVVTYKGQYSWIYNRYFII